MSLKLSLLKKVKHLPNKIVAQCPACAETGGDSKGAHLAVYPEGRFGCTANPKDKAHRRRIAELVGDKTRQVKAWTLRLHGHVVLSGKQPRVDPGTPISSLARDNVEKLKTIGNTQSEVSVATNPGQFGHLFSIEPIHKNKSGKINRDTVYIEGPIKASETSVTPTTLTQSGMSDEVIAKALVVFGGKIVAVVPPDGIVPARFRDVLATCPQTRNHRGLQGSVPLRLLGWTVRGRPIYR